MTHLVRYLTITFLGFLAYSTCSCKKFVEVDIPDTIVTTSTLFSSDQTASAAVSGLYFRTMISLRSITNGGPSIFLSLSADELYNTATNTSLSPFTQNELTSTTANLQSGFWYPAYAIIYQANAILEGLEKSPSV